VPKRLRAVQPGEKPARKLSIMEAVEANDRRALLLAMQQRLASAVADSAEMEREFGGFESLRPVSRLRR